MALAVTALFRVDGPVLAEVREEIANRIWLGPAWAIQLPRRGFPGTPGRAR